MKEVIIMEEKELELSVEKRYDLPELRIVSYKGVYLAVAVNLARWIVLDNDVQLEILKKLIDKASIAELIDRYEDNQEDLASVLTQIEATRIEKYTPKSVFANTRLHLHFTNKCNLQCPHCYMKSGKAYDEELTTEEIKVLCRDFKSIGGTDVSLTGGEPTVRPDFLDIVDYISEIGMKVSVFSNGALWNEDMIRRFSKCNIEGVQISIDGYDEQTNSEVRGKGVFEKSLNTVDMLIKNHIHVIIAITPPYHLIKEHQKEYIEFAKKMIEKYGNEAIEISFSYSLMPGRNLSEEQILITKEEYYRLVDGAVNSIYPEATEDSFVSNLSENIFDSCGYGGLNVMANGDFFFCDRIPDVKKCGNIRSLPIDDIHRLMQRAEHAGRIDNFKPCRTCELKYICGGGCRAEHFKQFTLIDDITTVDFDMIKPRKCEKEEKEKYYDLMIKTKERFYC